MSSFTREQLIAHHREMICAENLVLAIAGDVDPDDVAKRISTRLADLPSGQYTQTLPPGEAAPTEIRTAEAKKDRAREVADCDRPVKAKARKELRPAATT